MKDEFSLHQCIACITLNDNSSFKQLFPSLPIIKLLVKMFNCGHDLTYQCCKYN